jgi:radical SAM superfamily enzyme YgiQ (UPF0313 family)
MKVQLLRAAAGGRKWLQVMMGPGYPLGLAYIAGALERAGHDVTAVDGFLEGLEFMRSYGPGIATGLSNEELASRVEADTRVVGISVMFTMDWLMVVDLCERIRRRRPDVTIVMGGEHVTSMAAFCLQTSQADFAVLGEGEETIVELLEALEKGSRGNLAHVAGIAYKERGEVVVTSPRPRIREVDAIAPPAWHLFAATRYSRERTNSCSFYSERITLPVLSSRGCPYQCTFCSSPSMWGNWRPRDPQAVADELEYYIQEFGATDFHFYDLTAVVKRPNAEALAREFIRRGLDMTWQLGVGTRIEQFDGELAALLKESGLRYVAFAPESGSESSRKAMKKHLSQANLERATRDAMAVGLKTQFLIIVGLPHETLEDLAATVGLAWWAGRMGVDEIGPNVFTPYPGSRLFDQLLEEGVIAMDEDLLLATISNFGFIPRYVTNRKVPKAAVALSLYAIVLTFLVSKVLHHPRKLSRELWQSFSQGDEGSFLGRILKGVVRSGWNYFTHRLYENRVPLPKLDYAAFSWRELVSRRSRREGYLQRSFAKAEATLPEAG